MRQPQLILHLVEPENFRLGFQPPAISWPNWKRILHMRPSSMLTLLLSTLTLLGGCAPSTPLVRTETVPVPYLVPLPAALTADCAVDHLPASGPLPAHTVIDWAEKNRVSLEDCSKRMAQIRQLQPSSAAGSHQ